MSGGSAVKGRTYDLKSAYKQLAVAEDSLPYAYVVVFNPHTRKPEIFQLLAAPFGATRSVYSFLRIIHSVGFIGVSVLNLVRSHFFDDFVVFRRHVQTLNAGFTVGLLFKLRGWQFAEFAEDGDKVGEFSQRFTALGVEIQLQTAFSGKVQFCVSPFLQLVIFYSCPIVRHGPMVVNGLSFIGLC